LTPFFRGKLTTETLRHREEQKPASKTRRLKEIIILYSFVPLCLGGYIISYTLKKLKD